MLTNFFYIILFFLLLGCSSSEDKDLSQYVPINERALNFNFVNEINKNNDLIFDFNSAVIMHQTYWENSDGS